MTETKENFKNGTNDIIFKNIMRNKKILKAVLNCIIDVDDFEYENVELPSNLKMRKGSVDVLVKSDDILINCEMNRRFYGFCKHRNVGYVFKLYVNGVKVSEQKITSVIQINFNCKGDNKLEKSKYVFKNEVNKTLTEKIKIYCVSLDKLKKAYYNKDEDVINKYKYVIMLFLDYEELQEFMKGDEIVKMYVDGVAMLNGEPAYAPLFTEEEEKILREEYAFDEGIVQGIKRGHKRGIKENKIKIAKRMLKEKLDLNLIAKCTGLTIKKIKQLEDML